MAVEVAEDAEGMAVAVRAVKKRNAERLFATYWLFSAERTMAVEDTVWDLEVEVDLDRKTTNSLDLASICSVKCVMLLEWAMSFKDLRWTE